MKKVLLVNIMIIFILILSGCFPGYYNIDSREDHDKFYLDNIQEEYGIVEISFIYKTSDNMEPAFALYDIDYNNNPQENMDVMYGYDEDGNGILLYIPEAIDDEIFQVNINFPKEHEIKAMVETYNLESESERLTKIFGDNEQTLNYISNDIVFYDYETTHLLPQVVVLDDIFTSGTNYTIGRLNDSVTNPFVLRIGEYYTEDASNYRVYIGMNEEGYVVFRTSNLLQVFYVIFEQKFE